VLAVLALAGCGGGHPSVSVTRGTPVPNGFTLYAGPGFELAVPSGLNPFGGTNSHGGLTVAWTSHSGRFAILVTDDPHPRTSLDQAAAVAAQGSRLAYTVTSQSVMTTHVNGARGARLVLDSGPHGGHDFASLPQRDAELIVLTKAGALIDVLAVAHGNGNPDPRTVTDSFRLTS
jgi:hypothetical protein